MQKRKWSVYRTSALSIAPETDAMSPHVGKLLPKLHFTSLHFTSLHFTSLRSLPLNNRIYLSSHHASSEQDLGYDNAINRL